MRDASLPERMARLPKDKRGYPIPFIVARDRAGEPLFTINDSEIVERQAAECLCGICGEAIEHGDFWFIGGPGSAFLPTGAYLDGPTHDECSEYALRVCPYLAAPRYAGRLDHKPAFKNGVNFDIAVDNSMLPDRPLVFVKIMTVSYNLTLSRHGGVRRFLPIGMALDHNTGDLLPDNSALRRMINYEVWRHGELVEDENHATGLIREALLAMSRQTPQNQKVYSLQPVAGD